MNQRTRLKRHNATMQRHDWIRLRDGYYRVDRSTWERRSDADMDALTGTRWRINATASGPTGTITKTTDGMTLLVKKGARGPAIPPPTYTFLDEFAEIPRNAT